MNERGKGKEALDWKAATRDTSIVALLASIRQRPPAISELLPLGDLVILKRLWRDGYSMLYLIVVIAFDAAVVFCVLCFVDAGILV